MKTPDEKRISQKASRPDRRDNKSNTPPPAVQQGALPHGRNRWWLGALALVLITPFLSILVAPNGRVMGHPTCDSATAYYHFVHFLGKCLREGVLPLWNPHIMLGVPFLGEGQASVFHPLSLLLALLKPSLAVNWLVVVSFVLTGLFFFGYLRALGLGQPASWCGAITWSFSSVMISRIYAGHLNILLTFISIPLVMMLWERYRAGGNVRHLVGISLAYALMIFAFYPQVLYIFSLFFLLYVLIQSGLAIIDRSSTAQREGKAILMLGVFILLGVCVGAIQLFPSMDFVSRSFRQEATIKFCGIFSFPPENVLTLVAPRFFGTTLSAGPDQYWGRNLFWEMWMYIGVLPLIMAVAGVWFVPRRRRVALLLCGAVFLLFGLGKNTPLFPWIYEHIPLFDVFRGSSKNTLVTLFCLVTLSSYGFQAWFGETDERKRRCLRRVASATAMILLLSCIAVMVFLVRDPAGPNAQWQGFVMRVHPTTDEMYFKIAPSEIPKFMRTSAAGASAALVRAVILIMLSLALFFLRLPTRWKSYVFVLPIALVLTDLLGIFAPLMRTFEKSMVKVPLVLDESAQTPYPPRILVPFNEMPNIAMPTGYSSAFGYTGNTLKRYNEFINHVQFTDPQGSRADSKFVQFTPRFAMLGFDAIALEREHVSNDTEQIGWLGDRVLLPYDETNSYPSRAFLAAAPNYFSNREDALSYVLSNPANIVGSPAIERTEPSLPAHPLDDDESVRFVSFSPNRIELEAQTKQPRELVLCSMFERNWKATVNGVPAVIEPANYVFRAVQVPAGLSRVTFEYKPAAFYWGLMVTLLSCLVLLVIFVGSRILSQRTRITTPQSSVA